MNFGEKVPTVLIEVKLRGTKRQRHTGTKVRGKPEYQVIRQWSLGKEGIRKRESNQNVEISLDKQDGD